MNHSTLEKEKTFAAEYIALCNKYDCCMIGECFPAADVVSKKQIVEEYGDVYWLSIEELVDRIKRNCASQ